MVLALARPATAWGMRAYGSLECRAENYFQDKTDCEDCEDLGVLGKFDYKLEAGSESWGLYLNPVARADSLGFARGAFSEWGDEDRHESYVTIREGYLEFTPTKAIGIGAGNRIFYWGVGEEINPTSFNPRRYLNLVEPEEIGLLSGWIKLDFPGGALIEFVVSKSETSQLPWEDDYRWRPSDLSGLIIEEPDVPDSGQFAARSGWSGTRGSFFVTYFSGYNDVPGFSMVSSGSLEPEYFRMDSIGMNLTADLGWFGARGEAACNIQEGEQDDYVQWLIGIDKHVSWERQSLYFLVQYLKENVITEGSNELQELDFGRLLKNALTAKIEYELGNWTFSLRGAYDFDGDGVYTQPKITRSWDAWQVLLGLNWLEGPSDSVFGKYDENDGVFLEVKFFF